MNIWVILMIISQISAISYNQPKFCSNASWNSNATTFATSLTIGLKPYDIFIDRNNTIYATNQQYDQIIIWSEGNSTPIRIISGNILTPVSLFVTTPGDIYVDSDNSSGRVDKWTSNSTIGIPTMYTCKKCYDLFIDISNTLYCSLSTLHRIVSMSLNSNSNILTTVAGTSSTGNTMYTLNSPYGIFVDINYDLYVADTNNNRIQLFRSGELNGTTVAGNTSSSFTIALNRPTGITLDADGNLFIVDRGNHRIIGSGSNGFRCVAGCNGSGSTSNKLSSPYTLSFDSFGNMFVTDYANNRMQMFNLITNSCDKIVTTTENTITSTMNSTTNSFKTTDSMTSQTSDIGILSSNIVSYNRPKFSPSTSWNPDGVTFATNETVGLQTFSIFIDINNTIYGYNRMNGEILVWFNNSMNATRLSGNYSSARGLFVSISGDIYVDNGYLTGQVEKYSLDKNFSVPVMYVGQECFALFIDANDILYCSMSGVHEVVTKPLNSNSDVTQIVAGTGCAGSMSNQLSSPCGIFVNINFDLYVADYSNHRIQRFRSGQLNGTTVAGNTSLNITITLNYPTGVTLDGDNNLYIADKDNNRIVASGPNGFRCLVGCTGSSGSASNQLNAPQILSFDSYGNMFVTDWSNCRIQKFLILNDELTTQQSILTSTIEKVESSSTFFVPPSCSNQNQIGLDCNISSTPCDIMIPCQNNGSCINNNNTLYGYICTCSLGFSGTKCEIDNRQCKVNTCWNNGLCNETSNATFQCLCQSGWTNIHCQTKINYCENVICLNNGICRSILLNFTCECLGTSYSGRYCQITEQTTVVHQIVSKSLAYVAIIIIISVVTFFIIMDVLKYIFGIDLTKNDLEKIKRNKRAKHIKRRAVVQRFVYVNAPSQSSRTTIQETRV